MKNKSTIWCYICAVIGYVCAAAYFISLIFIPIGIYAAIYSNRYLKVAKLGNSELAVVKPLLVNAAIFFSIFAFPLGLVTIIPACIAGVNTVKQSSSQEYKNTSNDTVPEGETVKAEVDSVTIIEESNKDEISPENLKKLEQLKKFRSQGLITQAEFEDAKKQLYNKK